MIGSIGMTLGTNYDPFGFTVEWLLACVLCVIVVVFLVAVFSLRKWRNTMSKLTLIVSIIFLNGCAQWYSARTTASYEAYGAKLLYDSSKNQENFHARIELDADGKMKALDVKTTATTAESAIAAAAASMAAMAEAITKLVPLIEKGALAAGS